MAEHGKNLMCVLLSRPTIALEYLPHIRGYSDANIIYYGVDMHHERMAMQAQVTNDEALRIAAAKMREMELHIWQQADTIVYPSEAEVASVRAILPGAPAFVVNLYAFDTFRNDGLPFDERSDVLFVAGFAHEPNVNAAVWLVEEIMEVIWRTRPNTKLFLVGSNPTEKVRSLASSRVEVTGWVSDEQLHRQYQQRRVALVPLKFGAGVKSKVVEACRFGLPLVTTPVGAQGLEGISAFTPLADEAEALAAATLRFLDDPEAWHEASEAQVRYARANFSREALSRQLIEAVEVRPVLERLQ
jgi:glycosyltransferase involved in cell wall biosynthesis